MTATCAHHHPSSAELGGLCPLCLLAAGLAPSNEVHETTIVRDGDPSDPSSDSFSGEMNRVTPGTTLAGRFRVTGMIGAGGMGEVYRADDLKLGQPVALKFLNPEFAATPASLSRLYAEVRLGRQVAHPNVCRLYDIVEFGHHRCIVMEYVDGEDLASLLKRVGRLTQRKAAAISRDLCEGLAASHQAGIVHGDLKPSNIMIDGRGRARIMDFGLSRLASDSAGATVAGTPAYMAPEQLAGAPPSFAADVYSLGLIGYEIFTGARVREGRSLTEIRESASKNVVPPSATGVTIDPSVEAIILSCLDPDPERRPATATHVLSRFPGRDPLDEVVAAGETPSPELVAAAERKEMLTPRAAAAILVSIIVLMALLAITAVRSALHLRGEPPKPPAVLADRAGIHATRLGLNPRGDAASWFGRREDLLPAAPSIPRAAGGSLLFFHRRSPAPLVPATEPYVRWSDPPVDQNGMVNLALDGQGRLRLLRARVASTPGVRGDPEVTWQRLFDAAELNRAGFEESASAWSPPDPYDVKKEWRDPASGDRVRAAARSGVPTWFSIAPAADTAGERDEIPSSLPTATYLIVLTASLVAGVILARRNVRLRRADHRGAQRTALSVFVCWIAYWLFTADHASALAIESRMATDALGKALFFAARVWLGYMALEPYVRRRLPGLIIGWNRLVSGRPVDPLVGRDLLVGAAAGAVAHVVEQLRYWIPPLLGAAEPPLESRALGPLSSFGDALGAVFNVQTRAVFFAFFGLFLLLLLRLALRRAWAAGIAWLALVTLIWTPMDIPSVDVPLSVIRIGILLLVLTRSGLLSFTAALYVSLLLPFVPWTSTAGAWWAPQFLVVAGAIALLAVWAFRAALAHRSILRRPALDD